MFVRERSYRKTAWGWHYYCDRVICKRENCCMWSGVWFRSDTIMKEATLKNRKTEFNYKRLENKYTICSLLWSTARMLVEWGKYHLSYVWLRIMLSPQSFTFFHLCVWKAFGLKAFPMDPTFCIFVLNFFDTAAERMTCT